MIRAAGVYRGAQTWRSNPEMRPKRNRGVPKEEYANNRISNEDNPHKS